ncbi:MAG: VWA domain-containing protein [Alphaproteobacteria bacterium]|nr:VWA domain-containing protein [Alphaproteobacteria bacterium]
MFKSLSKETLGVAVSRFIHSEAGMTLPLLGFSLVVLIGVTGVAIDLARVQMTQAKLQFSVDSAGLAAGAKVSNADPSAEFKKYLDANFNNYMGAVITEYSVEPNDTNTVFKLSATATMSTTFMRVLKVQTVALSAYSEVTRAVSGLELVFVLDNTGSMNDIAGGSDTKLAALQTAANTLIDKLFGAVDTSTNDKLFVGIVPFSQMVNIGTAHADWINPDYTYRNAKTATGGPLLPYYSDNLDWGPDSWQGCVDARLEDKDVTDDPPAQSDETTLFGKSYWTSDNLDPTSPSTRNKWHRYTENAWKWRRCSLSYTHCQQWRYTCVEDWTHKCQRASSISRSYVSSCQSSSVYNESDEYCKLTGDVEEYVIDYTYNDYHATPTGPNLYCPQKITAMTNSASELRTAINAMIGVGNTEINQGLQWAWFMLSPRWKGLWGGFMDSKGLPLNYRTTGMAKAVVLLTDGVNTTSTNNRGAYWYPKDNRMGTTYYTLDQKTAKLCASMKANKIVIYTIALGTDDMNTSLLRSCASDASHAFISPSTAQLQSVFDEIGDSLSNLRVSH